MSIRGKMLPVEKQSNAGWRQDAPPNFDLERAARLYEMDVRYFDQNNGASKFRC